MTSENEEMRALFQQSAKCIVAIGDETRQAILLTLLEQNCDGMRVGEIAKGTHLSQPAISHHLKILCDAGVLTVRKSGTMNYYQINPDQKTIETLHLLCGKILEAIEAHSNDSVGGE